MRLRRLRPRSLQAACLDRRPFRAAGQRCARASLVLLLTTYYLLRTTHYLKCRSEMRKVLTAMNVVLRATESQNRAFSEADVDTFVKNPSPSPSPSPNPNPNLTVVKTPKPKPKPKPNPYPNQVETFVKTLFEEAGANDRLNRQSVSHYYTPSRKPTAHAHTELPLHSHRQVKLRRLCQGRQESPGDNRLLSGEQVGHAGPHATPHSPIVGHVLARCGSKR